MIELTSSREVPISPLSLICPTAIMWLLQAQIDHRSDTLLRLHVLRLVQPLTMRSLLLSKRIVRMNVIHSRSSVHELILRVFLFDIDGLTMRYQGNRVYAYNLSILI